MKRYAAIVSVVLSILVLGHALSAADLDDAFVQDTRGYLSKLERLGFAGVLVVAENGTPAISEGYGLADREHGVRWTPRTVSCIGSITKQFTAAGIMRLQGEGRLSVEDRLGTYFPDAPPDKATITLHHLMTHSSGLSDPEGLGDYDPIGREEYIRRVLAAPLAFAPGERYEYVNANFSLLGAVIEKVTGKSYEPAMRELIFRPAGLDETGYRDPRWDASRMAQGYIGRERWGTILERPMGEDGPYWALRANGGIHSTAEEMVRWSYALLDPTVLSAKARDALWAPYVDESNGDSLSFYGYGWSIVRVPPGVKVVTHNGGNGIFFADLAIVPDRKIVAFVQTNVIADFQTSDVLLSQIGRRMFEGKPYPHVPEVVDADPAKLSAAAGSYRLTGAEGGDRFEVTVDGNSLRIDARGWTAYSQIHTDPGEDPAKLSSMSREIERIVGAYLKGDFTPLHEAYGKAVPIDELKARHDKRRMEAERNFGAFKSYEVLGTGTDERHYLTVVRFRYERGDVTRAYAWDRSREKKLLGMVMRSMDPTRRFFPVKEGRFESWDPSTGLSIPARFESLGGGSHRLVISRPGGDVMASRIE